MAESFPAKSTILDGLLRPQSSHAAPRVLTVDRLGTTGTGGTAHYGFDHAVPLLFNYEIRDCPIGRIVSRAFRVANKIVS